MLEGRLTSGVSVIFARRRGDAGAVRVEPQRPARATDVLLPQLQTDQERFRLATEALVGFLYDYDLTTGLVERFGGLEEVVGFKPAEISPSPEWWTERIHPDDVGRVMADARKAFDSDVSTYAHQYRMRHREGYYIYIGDRGRIIRDQAGRAVRALGGVSDITDRKRAEAALHASEERFRLGTEALAGFLFDWDPLADRVTYFGGMEETVGFRPEEVPREGAWWRARIHPEDAPRVHETRNVALQGTPPTWTVEYRLQHRDGHYIDVVSRGRVVFDQTARAVRVVGGVYDVSERRRFDRDRETLLERERETRAAAEAASRARDDVLGVVSHEMRTAISAIEISASGLLQSSDSPSANTGLLHSIQQSATSLDRLITDLLDIAMIEAGHLAVELHEAVPSAILAQVAEMFAPLAAAKGVTLETIALPNLPTIEVDDARVAQALSNLVTNALKFTDWGGSITLAATWDPDGVCFSVADTGVGIVAVDLPHVFDRFWEKRRYRGERGTGLGLAIVRGIVEAHRGEVAAESAPGEGSRFSFTLPLATKPQGKES
jgi:PAS domain S-box-containing protein